jgi:CIC family chloride channel protein
MSLAAEHRRLALHLAFVAAPVGALVGVAIAAYDYLVNSVLWEHVTRLVPMPWLCAAPFVALTLSGTIIALFGVRSTAMADEVVRAYHEPQAGLDYRRAWAKLLASLATMGFGASAGMEGASKWLGALVAGLCQRAVNRAPGARWLHGRLETTLLAGASAGIAAIFRAPLTGAIMGVESPYKRDLAHEALLHSLVAAALSYATFCMLRPSTPYFPITFTYRLDWRDLAGCVPVGIGAGLASHAFLGLLGWLRRRTSAWRVPLPVRAAAGGALLSLVAWTASAAVGSPATLQSGLGVANELLNGRYALVACLAIFGLKLVATAVTFGMGGVGGLFVPSATIGAALGAAFDHALAPTQPGLFTLVAIAAFTGASYNSLLFAAVFVAEATGSPALVVPGLVASSVAFLVASGVSNGPSQRLERAAA